MEPITLLIDELNPVLRNCGIQTMQLINERTILDYELMFCSSGKGSMVVNGKKYSFQKGDLLFFKPGISHKLTFKDSVLYWVHLDFLFYSDIYEMHKNVRTFHKPINQMTSYQRREIIIDGYLPFPNILALNDKYESLQKLFKSLISYQNNDRLKTKISLLSIIYIFLEPLKKASNSEDSKSINILHSYLDRHYTNQISSKLIEQMTKYNIDHVRRCFKKAYNKTIMGYVLEKRISHAKNLLIFTNQSISTISQSVGFNDIYYFSKRFKKATNFSPLQYRKRFKKDNF